MTFPDVSGKIKKIRWKEVDDMPYVRWKLEHTYDVSAYRNSLVKLHKGAVCLIGERQVSYAKRCMIPVFVSKDEK